MTNIFHAGKCRNHQRQRRRHFALFVTFLPAGFHRHRVLYPPGSSGPAPDKSSSPTALTASIQARIFTRVLRRRHPVGESLMRLISPICVAAILVNASPTARRAEAAKSSKPAHALANRHRFTVVAVEAGGSDRAVSDRHRHGPTHLIARYHAGYAAVANGHQEGFPLQSGDAAIMLSPHLQW